MKKIAIILMNLGGPDSLSSVKPFLFNLFYDKEIIRYPNPFRWIIAKIISGSRYKYSMKIYEKMGGKSPILDETIAQKNALDKLISEKKEVFEWKSFVYMRYWHPMSEEVSKEVRKYNPDEVILLPLYPHYSTSTTKSSINEIKKNIEGFIVKSVCCYHDFDLFIDAHIENIKQELYKIKDFSKSILLFSAHSVPKKFIEDGDPYEDQIKSSVRLIIEKLAISELESKITYQSKVGPMEWLSPNTEDEIKKASNQNKDIYIIPISFVSEHSETLVELDIDYKELAIKEGCAKYHRFNTLSLSEKYIECLYELLKKSIDNKDEIISATGTKCKNFKECPCVENTIFFDS